MKQDWTRYETYEDCAGCCQRFEGTPEEVAGWGHEVWPETRPGKETDWGAEAQWFCVSCLKEGKARA